MTQQDVRFHGFAVTLLVMGLLFLIVNVASGGIAYFLAIPFFFDWWLGNYSIQNVRIQFSIRWGDYLIRILIITVLNLITFGLYYPWGECWKWRILASCARWNNEPLEFTGSGIGFLFCMLLQFIVGGSAMAAAVIFATLLASPFESVPLIQFGIIILIPGTALALTLPFVRLIMERWWWRNLIVGGQPVRLYGNGWDYTRFCLFPLLLSLLTLGLYLPFFFAANERWLAARMVHSGKDAFHGKSSLARSCGIGFIVLILLAGGAIFLFYQNPFQWDLDSGKRLISPIIEKAGELKTLLEEKTRGEQRPAPTRKDPVPTRKDPAPSGDEAPTSSGEKAPPQSGSQQVFKWKDENGVTHFTDDPTHIPERYRNRVDPVE